MSISSFFSLRCVRLRAVSDGRSNVGRRHLVIAAVAVLALAPNILGQSGTHSPGWVVLSIEDYRALRARAFPAEREPAGSPVDATLTRVDYELRILASGSPGGEGGDAAAGRAALTVDVLKDGWVRIPVPAGLLVREARLDGKLVALVPGAYGKGGSQLSALLSHPGRSVLQLDIALPVNSSAGQQSFSVPSAGSGVTKATVQLARQNVDVKLSGGLLAEKSENGAESKWVAYGRGNEPLTFTWHRKTEDHHLTQALRLRGSLTELVELSEDGTPISAEVNLEVTQGAAREVKIEVPEKVTVNQVLGAEVADWEMKDGVLSVTFLEPVEQSARFVITGETRSPRDGVVEIPLLRVAHTERDSGGVAVEVLGAGEIQEVKSQGLENADASDLGEMVASRESPSLAAFKFRTGSGGTNRALAVNVVRYTTQAVLMANVEEARYHVLLSKEGKTLVQALYAVRNNERNFLKLTLPAGATLWSASLGGRPVRPGQAPDGGLLLPLEKARTGEEAPAFAVEVVYLERAAAWNDKGQVKLPLPALDLPISRTGVVLHYPPLFKLTAEPGAFHTQAYEAPVSNAFLNELNRPIGNVRSGPGDIALSEFGRQSNLKDDLKQGSPNAGPAQAANQAALDKFREKSKSGKVAGILPIRVAFPMIGPSLFLVSELTAENQAANAELTYQHEKKSEKKAGGK